MSWITFRRGQDEKSGRSFMLSICRAGLLTIPLLFLLSNYFGIIGVWATIPLTEAITMIIFQSYPNEK